MAAMHVKHWIEGGRRVLRLLGTFDGEAACELFRRLRGEDEGDIVIDIALVRDFDEVGVAALARLAEHTGQRIMLRGLSAHQLRVLRYLGASLSTAGAEVES